MCFSTNIVCWEPNHHQCRDCKVEFGHNIQLTEKIQIVKLNLMSKNNKATGSYLYSPIVLINGDYFHCESLIKNKITKIKDLKNEEIKPTRIIKPEFLKSNGIHHAT